MPNGSVPAARCPLITTDRARPRRPLDIKFTVYRSLQSVRRKEGERNTGSEGNAGAPRDRHLCNFTETSREIHCGILSLPLGRTNVRARRDMRLPPSRPPPPGDRRVYGANISSIRYHGRHPRGERREEEREGGREGVISKWR